MVAVVDRGAVGLQFGGNSSPIIQMLKVAKEYAVHHENRIACLVDAGVGAFCIAPIAHPFHLDFRANRLDNNMQHDQMRDRNPSANNSQHTPADTELFGRQIHRDDTNPENHRLDQHDDQQADQPICGLLPYALRSAEPSRVAAEEAKQQIHRRDHGAPTEELQHNLAKLTYIDSFHNIPLISSNIFIHSLYRYPAKKRDILLDAI